MKLYLREILKEANALGFGAPGQGGNSSNVSMAQTAPGPSMLPSQPPLMQPNAQMGGMQLPGSTSPMGGPGQQLQLGNPSFKPVL